MDRHASVIEVPVGDGLGAVVGQRTHSTLSFRRRPTGDSIPSLPLSALVPAVVAGRASAEESSVPVPSVVL